MSTPTATFSFIKKGKSRPNALRKRPVSDDESTATTSEVIIAAKKTSLNHLVQGTGFTQKRRKAEAELSAAIESDSDEGESFEVRHSATTERPRRRSSSPPPEVSGEAIKFNKTSAAAKEGRPEAVVDDGMYHGKAGAAHKLPKGFGPIKGGPANVRTITLVDYQPDVCKDYKETGFCGFGDTCKFLHDRGDYLHGWQLDNSFLSSSAAGGSFLAKQAARANGEQDADDPDNENEDLPFACLLCRKPFGNEPIITLCGHYFDSGCAVKRFAKTGKCFACGKGTNGVFNKATKIIAQTKERERLEAAAALEERDFEADDDEAELDIEGLETRTDHIRPGATNEEEEGVEEGDEYEEEAPVVKRRPIIELQ